MAALHNPITHREENNFKTNSRLNWLRAAVLGANDGIVSVASVVVGVAGATDSRSFVLTAGVAALVAGALSMAVGEYVSVSSQRDTERALLAKERIELETMPEEELEELTQIYEKKGLSRSTAEVVAKELTAHDAFAAHVDAELHIDPDDLTNPMHAAYASALAFFSGAIIPILAILLSSARTHVLATFISCIIALIITGMLSAYVGGANKLTATVRVVLGGILAMLVTFGIGKLFGVSGV
ncbi:MAG TPA: VIT family protein [Candidatus Paceibacterota bacterium]|jgi:VIT1/CCC1 family predicted Fe2+/Mn2+ transporter|nr:VIT family protein [Candidatus Paceibacterota bacterium]